MMDTERFEQLADLLGQALELPPDRRAAFLRDRCAHDDALLQEALSLLERAGATSLPHVTAFLQQQVGEAAHELAQHVSGQSAARPAAIGPYLVLEELGEGGMGVVYRAQQQHPLRREVAIKVIRGGPQGESVARRFEFERRTLALLEHPNIARVYDAGTTADGRPYFVMELVEGIPLGRYCDQLRLDVHARLALFVQVCQGVQHAHRRGIIHRDLKPSNVLVTEIDGQAVPKIIDFGIAKATDGSLDGRSLFTEAGLLVGTPEYMSPEQTRLTPEVIDTRSDVYSLGVMLYELLAGQLPFEPTALRRAALAEIQRVLQEQDPPRPSQRLDAAGPAGSTNAAAVAAARGTDLRALRRRLRGDLDWVVMRALAKDPDRRYQSAHDLAVELQHVLRDEPVQAGPPSVRYRIAKFARRHRAGVIATATAVAALVAGATLATVGLVRATRSHHQAQQEASRAQAVTDFLTDMLSSVQPENAKGEEITVRQVLDEAAARLAEPGQLTGQPEVEAALRNTIGDTYKALGLYDAALPQLQRALELRQARFGPGDERVLETLDHIGEVHYRKGDLAGSLATAQEVLRIRERTVGRLNAQYSQALGNVAITYADMGDYTKAEELLREALAIDRQVLRPDQGELLAYSLNNLASVLGDERRYAEAVPLHRESLELRRRFLGERSPAVANSLSNLGFALLGAGDRDSAVTVLRDAAAVAERVFGPDHPRTASVLSNLGGALRGTAHPQEAEAPLRRALAINVASVGASSWQAGSAHASLGSLLVTLGRDAEAEQELLAGYDVLLKSLGPGHDRTRGAATSLSNLYASRGSAARAASWKTKAQPAK